MRKTYNILICLIMIGIMMGCASPDNDSYPTNARSTVNAFIKELLEGDISGALKYCDIDSEAYNTLEPITEENMLHDFAISMASSLENQEYLENNEEIQRLIHTYYEYMFKGYQIIDYTDEKDSAFYEVSISYINYDENNMFSYMIGPDIYYRYYDENQEELEALAEEGGDEAVLIKYIEAVGKEIVNEYIKNLQNGATYSNRTCYITLEKKDSGWTIMDFDMS